MKGEGVYKSYINITLLWVFNWRLSEASSQIYNYQNKNLQKSQKVD